MIKFRENQKYEVQKCIYLNYKRILHSQFGKNQTFRFRKIAGMDDAVRRPNHLPA